MKELSLYAAMSRFRTLDYRAKIMLMAFLGTHVPLLALIGYFVLSVARDTTLMWTTLGVALVATLLGTAVTLYVLDRLLAPVLLTSRALRHYGSTREVLSLPTEFTDEAGTLMADASRTLTRLEDTLRQLETIDTVTGLGNRAQFLTEADAAIREQRRFAAVLLRLSNFGRLIVTYDQAGADAFIRTIADRLGRSLAGTSLCRVDSNAFAFMLPIDGGVQHTAERLSRLMAELVIPVAINGITVLPELAAGAALHPEDGATGEALLGHAIAASAGNVAALAGGVRFHSVAARDAVRSRFEMEQALRLAITGNQFLLNFQPVVDLSAGRTVGAEALIRWKHPERGMIAPGQFIPTAERSGLIDEIGLWVVREACAQMARWENEALAPLKMAINLSARQFHDPRLIGHLTEALDDARVSPERLEIELTESAAMVDHEYTRQVFTQLRDLGVSIAIDDFGTGYASMSYLRKLPFNKLKIDREFVSNVDTQSDSQAICGAMIALSRGLGLQVLAEGAERREEVDYLSAHGCDLFQGYYFARPVAADAMAETLDDIALQMAGMDAVGDRRGAALSA